MPPALIAIDWGSSSFRAYLMARRGRDPREVGSADGIGTWRRAAFPPRSSACRTLAGRAPCPAGYRLGHGRQPARLARGALCAVAPPAPATSPSRLVEVEAGAPARSCSRPGLSYRGRDRAAGRDPRRGGRNLRRRRCGREPYRAARLAFEMGEDRGRPGRGVQDFRDRRIVRGAPGPYGRRRLRPGRAGEAARGQRSRSASGAARRPRAGEGKSGLLGLMFGARALPLMGELAADDAGDYLSGLLIGAEIAEALRLFPGEDARARRGRGAGRALPRGVRRRWAFTARAAPPRAAARGLFRIAQDGGLLSMIALSPSPAHRNPARRDAGRGRCDRRGPCRGGVRRDRGSAEFARSAGERRDHRARCSATRILVGAGTVLEAARGRRGRRKRARNSWLRPTPIPR